MYTIQALWTAARHRVGAKFVVCNNGRYRLLDDNLDHYRAERGIPARPAPEGFALEPEIGFAEIARGLGVTALRVDKAEQAADAVDLLLDTPGPVLLDVAVRG
jgi:benzoylformate decarboxylase